MDKFNGVRNAPPEKRYKNFVSTVVDMEKVWYCKKGTLQVWPGKDYALSQVPLQDIASLEVHNFCELLKKMRIASEDCIQVFPTNKDCFEIHPEGLLKDILDELERVE